MKIINEIFNKISTPLELLEFMSSNINYGYLGKNGIIYNCINEKWFDEYLLQNEDKLLETLHGNCWDQVELERYWFENNGYEVKTIYEMVDLNYKNQYPTHSFLIFKDKENNWCWFECSDIKNKGIHKFNSINELLKYQYNKYIDILKEFNINDDELKRIILREFEKPKINLSAHDYIEFVMESRIIKFENR